MKNKIGKRKETIQSVVVLLSHVFVITSGDTNRSRHKQCSDLVAAVMFDKRAILEHFRPCWSTRNVKIIPDFQFQFNEDTLRLVMLFMLTK